MLVYHGGRRTSKPLARLILPEVGRARPVTPPERRAPPLNTPLPAAAGTAERLCTHHWIIDAPHPGEIRGACKLCGATRVFAAAAADWPDRRSGDFVPVVADPLASAGAYTSSQDSVQDW
jgi:hypothetical protein